LNAVQGKRLAALYWTALLLGLREGELLGLRWQDVDLDRQTLGIAGAISRQKQANGRSRLVLVPTKTQAGARTLPLPALLCSILREHKAGQDEERRGPGWEEHGLVFPSERGTPLEAGNLVSRSFKPALKRAGLADMRFHDLRHTTASLLLASGVDTKTVSAILGHTSPAFTLATYAHVLPEITRQAVAGLGDLLGNAERGLEVRRS
jgi:integrase